MSEGTITYLGSATNDLAGYEGYGGLLTATRVELAGAGTAEFLITAVGPLTAAGTSLSQPISVRYTGKAVGYAGGTIAAGDRLQTNASGEWIVATSGQSACAMALEIAASGETFDLIMSGAHYAYPEA